MKKSISASMLFAVFTFAVFFVTPIEAQKSEKLIETEKPIRNQYIVVLEDWSTGNLGADSKADLVSKDLTKAYGGKVKHVYDHVLNGFSTTLNDKQLEMMLQDGRVKYIERDGEVSINQTQNNATWGLDRIDQRNLPLNGTYNYTRNGSGVNAYIIDTGIRRTHSNFGGRARVGFDAFNDGQNSNDCNGHGTHVAGTVGSSTYGVAKNVRLYAVRVLNCSGSGSNSGVIAGINWVANNRVLPAVANMSLGGGASTATDNAVQNAINRGVTMVVAAGNENQNACNVSPARAANAITVGSTTRTDVRSSFSNFGTCVDIFAPGSSITSTWSTSNSATRTISGTSMASPHVAGVAALYLQGNSSASPATVTSAIINSASTGKLSSINSGSPNRLVYSPLSGSPPPPPPPPSGCGGVAYNGSLSGSRDADYQRFFFSGGGTHTGNLSGPGNADFDLYLQKWINSRWRTVRSSTSGNSTESINYSGSSGYYRWVIYSYSGSGSYSLCTTRP